MNQTDEMLRDLGVKLHASERREHLLRIELTKHIDALGLAYRHRDEAIAARDAAVLYAEWALENHGIF
jgi:hypothetical protein